MNGKFLHVFLFLVFVFSARFGIGIVSNTTLPQALPGIQVSGGNLNATVDISVPEGTHGLTPNLDLVYNSAAGTGLLGLGWELSGLHSVSRDPSYPISYSDSDHFSSSVSGGLIQNGGTQEYGTNPETLMKYKFNGESWTAKDRSGTVYQFGSDDSRNSRVKSPERGTDRNAVRKWGLDSVKDLNGNSYTVDYDGSQELLPVKIEYGSGNRTVEFGYDSALKNKGAREGYVYSSKVLEDSILKSVTMKAGGTKVREYVFSYDVSSADGIPRLNKIDRTDYINGQAEFYSIALGYTADQAVSISQTPKSLDLDETFVQSRTPMSDKMTCIQGERDCYEAANTNCVSGATYISCRTRHNEVIRACNEYTRLWKNPCFLGVTLPNNTMTVGDVNADSVLQKETHPDGSYTVTSESGFTVSSAAYTESGGVLSSETVQKNETGQVLKRTVQGKTLSYKYDPAGRLSEISDPENGKTSILYDTAGRKKSQTDENSGTVSYTYDSIGSLKTQKDARGVILTYQYDALNRVEKIDSSTGEVPVLFSYDSGANALGRMSRVQDETGEAHFEYDLRGNMISALKKTDELNVVFRRFYDVLGRLKTSVYPDGTKTHSRYSQSGHLYEITMDSADGQSTGHSLIRYGIEVPDGESLELVRTAGNGTETRIRFDELKKRPLSLAARLNGGHLEQLLSYSYDEKGNITAVEDRIIEGRTQRFEYDGLNRITKASGRYGTEEYRYSEGGNLLQRGAFALKYNDSMHRHAVTEASGPNTGSFQYVYDSAGNMISRNGDVLLYNSRGKMKEMTANGSDKTVYWYDYSGERIKKEIFRQGQSAQTVYSFGGLYDIVREPGQPDRHTLYFKGLQGDLVAQMTREDAVLVGIGDQGLGISRISYIANRIQYSLKSFAVMMFHPKNREVRDALLWFGVMGIVVFILGIGNGQWGMGENGHRVAASKYAYRDVRFSTGILLVSILFEFTACVGKKGGKDGTPPWVLIQSGVSGDTVSISDPGYVPGQGSGLGGQGSVNGMFFLHQDHLGSITMVTDGAGNVVSGGSLGGKANYHYRPYGEIDRMNSSGPDLTKFKYTGQVEDKESGLYYYKARYYDPVIGRFLSADSMSFPDHNSGMNPYMYVMGNPVMNVDPTGNFFIPAVIVSIAAVTIKIANYRKAEKNRRVEQRNETAAGLYLLANSGINAEKFAWLYTIGRWAGKSPRDTWFGHNYTGSGNRDNFSRLNSHYGRKRLEAIRSYLFGIAVLNQTLFKDDLYSIEQIIGFLAITKLLAPRPKSFADKLAIGHDREVPDSQFQGSYSQHMRADGNYIAGFMNGLSTGEAFRQPIDSFIGLGGSAGLALDSFINAFRGMDGGKK